MTTIDYGDVQGLTIRGYRMPCARYCFLRVVEPQAGRRFVHALEPHVTDASRWEVKPEWTVNIAFTYEGCKALKFDQHTLTTFAPAFRQGMRDRAELLGDDGPSAPQHWDDVWQEEGVHIFVFINAVSDEVRQERYRWLEGRVPQGVALLPDFQDVAVLLGEDGAPSAKEHFGYTDGIGQPSFEGLAGDNPPGRGKVVSGGGWAPLKTGEFLFGYEDEGNETVAGPQPPAFAKNGTYLVYRKLHQNVKSFRDYLDSTGKLYPGGREMLAAKLVGRWRNGTPLELAPEQPWPDDQLQANPRINDFVYSGDPDGLRCPIGAHLRRANPRDSMGFKGLRANRRRVIRRGLPYGLRIPEDEPATDDGEHGVAFMVLNADIDRQFEFVQQEWMNYANHFHLANDKDALIGNHDGTGKALIEGDPPFFCTNLKRFVVTRGGDYFFLPSRTALRMIAEGREGAAPSA